MLANAAPSRPTNVTTRGFQPSARSPGSILLMSMFAFILSCGFGAAAQAQAQAQAQTQLPAPSRTAFKCEADGKVSYSDSPCLGAKKVDLEPTRGLSSSVSGKSPLSASPPLGADVQRERQREALAEAIKPITGLDAKQFDIQGRRLKQLSPEARQSCARLDRAIPAAEAAEASASASKASLPAAQEHLLQLRRRFRELRC